MGIADAISDTFVYTRKGIFFFALTIYFFVLIAFTLAFDAFFYVYYYIFAIYIPNIFVARYIIDYYRAQSQLTIRRANLAIVVSFIYPVIEQFILCRGINNIFKHSVLALHLHFYKIFSIVVVVDLIFSFLNVVAIMYILINLQSKNRLYMKVNVAIIGVMCLFQALLFIAV